MSKAKYSETEKKQPGGRHVWGVLQMEGRKQKFRTVAALCIFVSLSLARARAAGQ